MKHTKHRMPAAFCICSLLLTGCAAAPGAEQRSGTEQPVILTTAPETEPVTAAPQTTAVTEVSVRYPALLQSADEISLRDTDGQGQHYLFSYDGADYSAEYTPDNWKIINSYQIRNAEDITLICQALAEAHPVHGADLISFRTAEDMAYEWQQHNIAYQLLSDESPWKQNTKDVDLNPADQGKSVYDLYVARTGSPGGNSTSERSAEVQQNAE